jgi:RHS repeat-associated protein
VWSKRVLFAVPLCVVALVAGVAAPASAAPGSRPGAREAGRSAGSADPVGWARGRVDPPKSAPGAVRRDPPGAGRVWPAARRVRELTGRRTENGTFYQLSDGRVQAEISQVPVHYRDAHGGWQRVDTAVRPSSRAGFVQGNTANSFSSFFGSRSDRLVRFEADGRWVELGVAGASRPVTARVDGSRVSFAGVVPGAELVYEVTPTALKEYMVLARRPAGGFAVTFTVKTGGVRAVSRSDGSVGFVGRDGERTYFTMPAPVMFDSRADAGSPVGKTLSDRVTQAVSQHGSAATVTVTADAGWLVDPARVFPVRIDPTVKIQPVPADGQDVEIYSGATTTNYNNTYQLKVGTDSTQSWRSLVKFPLTGVPAGTVLDDAQLMLYYDQTHTDWQYDVAMEARRVTASWSESSATWANMAGNIAAQPAGNMVTVDDGDAGTSVSGTWPYSTNPTLTPKAINGDYRYNNDTTAGNTHTWVPTITEAGDYQVEAHFTTESDRPTNAPYTVYYSGGSKTYQVDQTGPPDGVWKTLGVHPFVAGTTGKVVLGDVVGKSVIADAVRFTKWGAATKKRAVSSVWNSFPVRNVAQEWVNGTQPNYGLMVKAVDEGVKGRGGPVYEASEYAYENARRDYNLPKLVLSWGRQGVTVSPPTTVTATGASLSWPAYVDPSGGTGDNIVEYQVHRSIYQTFTPSAATLVAPVASGTLAYQDTTAAPTPTDETDPLKRHFYYYMVAVKTADGQVIPGPTQGVLLPKAGQITRVFRETSANQVPDTTLSQAQPDTNVNVYDGDPYVAPGNNSTFYGDTRGLVKFTTLGGFPTGAQVVDAQLQMWNTYLYPGTTTNGKVDVHRLTRGFDETTATWNKANSTTAWTTPGGDYDPTAESYFDGFTNDPEWENWTVTNTVRGWLASPATNNGFLLKFRDESVATERAMLLASEGADPMLRPTLQVTYLEPTPASTYFAPYTPSRMIPGDIYPVTVSVSNPTVTTWAAANWELSYHWALPDGTDVTTGGNQVATPLPKDILPGATVDIAATVKTPIQSDSGNKRTNYVLRWELHNKTTGQWLSTVAGIPSLDQNVAVEDPTSDQLGFEKFYQYAGQPTGAGTSVAGNLSSGNLVFSYNPLSNPSRGVASFVRLTYNSMDTSASSMGFGWSLSASSVMRLGSALDFHPRGQDWPTQITLTDGDGTSHFFSLNTHNSTDQSVWDYDHPAGVHLYLQKTGSSDASRAWVMTAPDRTKFYFDDQGFQSALSDNNGNELLFTYESRKSANKPTKFLRYLTDPAGRQTLTLDYYAKGDSYTYIDDTGAEVSASNLTNPFIIDQVKSVTDISGRQLTFTYTTKGLMAKLVDGAGNPAAKTFRFGYDATQGNKNVKLVSVTDPRGHTTNLNYYSLPEDNPQFHWWAKTITDRLGNPTGFAYTDPDGTAGSTIQTVVTDAEAHASTMLMDGFGRLQTATDAKGRLTQAHFDADNNLDRLQEANGAVTTWGYDPVTGLPQSMTDAQANHDATPATTYAYQTSLNGHVADLTSKTSPEGRVYSFGYDAQGNLLAVTDPAGNATPTAGDFTTTYTYDAFGQLSTATDANGHTTHYASYDPNGYPQTITDPLTNATQFTYDARGEVTRVTDPLTHHTTQNYDVFGRPLDRTVPKDEASNKFITTPAPIYDANDNVTQATDATGAVTTAVYDNDDRISSGSLPKDTPTGPDRTTAFTYDKVGNTLTETAPNGTLTTSDPNDFVTRYGYDEVYQLTALTNAAGGRVTYAYDNVGNMVTEVDANKNATTDPADFTAKYTYDLDHRTKTVTDAAGNAKSTDYDRDGLTVATTDEDGNRTLITPDPRGMTAQVQVPFKNNGGTTVYNTTRYSYDQAGNQTKVESPRGVATTGVTNDFIAETTYDELNRVKDQLTPFDPSDSRYNTANRTTYNYDPAGRLASVSAPPSAGQSVRNDTRYTYFDNGWTRTSTDPWDIVTSYDYDNNGKQLSRTLTPGGEAPPPATDPHSAARGISWTYYPDGKLKSRTDDGVPVGSQIVLVDNSDAQNVSAVGSWPSSTSGTGFQGFDYQTHGGGGTGANTFGWNLVIPQDGTYQVFVKYPAAAATNAQYTVTTTGGSTTRTVNQSTGAGTWVSLGSFSFTAGGTGQKVSLSDAANGTVAADAVKLVRDNSADTDNEKTLFSFGYDPDGNQTQVTDSSPNALIDTYAVTYDGLDQVAKVEEKLAGVVKHTTGFTYDANGNTVNRTHDQSVSTFGYDVRDLLAQVTNKESASDPNPKTSTFTYTNSGQVAREAKPNRNTVDSAYFLNGALQHQIEKKSDGTTVVSEHTFDYDPDGNQVSDISKVQNADNHSAYVNRTATSTYDPLDRLAALTKKDQNGATVDSESYIHDANNNVTSETVNASTTTSVYNRNRLQTNVQTTGGISVTSSYNYDPFGRLDTVTTAAGLIAKYTYDGFDHIATEKKKVGAAFTTTRYTYDPFDRTASQTTDAGGANQKITLFHYLAVSNALDSEEEGGRTTKSYQYSPWGERLAQIIHKTDGSEEPTYYSYNAHSDVEAVTDANGDTKSTYGYTAYGAADTSQNTGADKPDPTNPTKDPYNAYQFNAARFDSATGTYDMGFRTYDPGLNTFLTRDLFNGALSDTGLSADPFTNNRYAFGAGNPLSSIELDGHFGWSDIGHMALDAAGMIPVVGAVADVANGVWYAAEGDYLDAGLSFAGAIPVIGDAALASRYAIKGAKYAIEGAEAAEDLIKAGKDIEHGVQDVKEAERAAQEAKQAQKAAADAKAAQEAAAARKAAAARAEAEAEAKAEAKAETKAEQAAGNAADTPSVVYRGGSRTADNMTPRPGVDTGGLSTFETLGSFRPGTKVQVINVSKLKRLLATPDAPPPGHVSIHPADLAEVADWAATRGTGQVHPYTQELLEAIIGEIRIPK